MKKFYLLIWIFFIIANSACSQNKFLDETNGYKIFKIGTVLDTTKVTANVKQEDGSVMWLVEDNNLLTIGDIKVTSASVTTYNDTIRSIILRLTEENGSKLALAYYDKFGFPKERNDNIYDGYEWKTEKISLNIRDNTKEYIAYYYDVKFMDDLRTKMKKKAVNDL